MSQRATPLQHKRRILPAIEQRIGMPYVAPVRAPTLATVTTTDMEYAALASLCGTLGGVAWAMGVTRQQAKNSIARLAAKIPGTLPSLARVIVWVRGGGPGVLGDTRLEGRIPEHLLCEPWRGQTAGAGASGRHAIAPLSSPAAHDDARHPAR
jgi:hypothetical protein